MCFNLNTYLKVNTFQNIVFGDHFKTLPIFHPIILRNRNTNPMWDAIGHYLMPILYLLYLQAIWVSMQVSTVNDIFPTFLKVSR